MKYIYTIILIVLALSHIYAHDPTEGLTEIPLTGLSAGDGYTFHFYSADGKLNIGFSEVFIALKDKNESFVEDFTVSDFYPLMDMGMSKHSTPVGKVEKVDGEHLYKTWFSFLMYTGQMDGTWTLNFNYTIGSSTTKSAIVRTVVNANAKAKTLAEKTIETQIGWFKDRHCVGAVTLPLKKSCGIGCGTGAGNMANCWNGGLGVFIYNPSDTGNITKVVARSDEHFLLFDAQSKELVRAFLLSLPSDASGKISVKVTGYRVENGISANSTESEVPELSPDSTVHYLNAFHLQSIEGVVIENQSSSYQGFAAKSYKYIPEDLAPSNLSATYYNGGTTIKFTPPANAGIAKSNLAGYKVRVYNLAGVLQDQYTTTSLNPKASAVNIVGLSAKEEYTFTVTALYPSSAVEVESEHANSIETEIGWFKDRDCLYDSVALPLQGSCWIDCGLGGGGMAYCWNSGLGVFIYNPDQSGKISVDSSRTDSHFLLGDAQSKELIRAFLLNLPTDANGKILVKVTGYRVANGISSNKSEWNVPELTPDSVDHYLNAFHILSIEGVVIDTLGYSGFATKSYKQTPADLAPSNLRVVSYQNFTTVHFTPPVNAGKTGSNLTGYKVRVYSKDSVLLDQFTTSISDSVATSINIPGLTAGENYNFSVAALYPSSNVEVESEHTGVSASGFADIVIPVDNYKYPSESKWLQNFTYNDTTYFVSVAYPKQLTVGKQTVYAYINKKVDVLQPFPVVNGGFKIEATPFMRSMGHGSSGNTLLEWNSENEVYEGTLNFSMEGDWRVNLKIFDSEKDSLIAGVDIDSDGNGSTHYWDIYLEETSHEGIGDIQSNEISVYPTFSQGEITVVTPKEATIKVLDINGRTLGLYKSQGNSKRINVNAQSGLYFVAVKTSMETSVHKVIIKK